MAHHQSYYPHNRHQHQSRQQQEQHHQSLHEAFQYANNHHHHHHHDNNNMVNRRRYHDEGRFEEEQGNNDDGCLMTRQQQQQQQQQHSGLITHDMFSSTMRSPLHAPLLNSNQSHSSDDDNDDDHAASQQGTMMSLCYRRWCLSSFHWCCCCCRSSNNSSNSRRNNNYNSNTRDGTFARNDEREAPFEHNYYYHHESQHHDRTLSTPTPVTGGCCFKLLYIMLTVLSFGGLYYSTNKYNQQDWSLQPGESRHVATAGFLTATVQVVSRTPSDSEPYFDPTNSNSTVVPINSNNTSHNNDTDDATDTCGIAVYAVESRDCPPLTGPKLKVDRPNQELSLLQHAYEYQYFYLNAGSTMKVTVHQLVGSTNILVLKGSKVLERIEYNKRKRRSSSSSSIRPSFVDALISDLSIDVLHDEIDGRQFLLEQISSEQLQQQQTGPIEFSFTSPSSNVYVLLFDNASGSQTASLQVKYEMVLTTYNIEGLTPWCSHSSPVQTGSLTDSSYSLPGGDDKPPTNSFTCPQLSPDTAGCILVEAVRQRHDSSHDDNTNSSSSSNVPYDRYQGLEGDFLVEVTVYTTRNWFTMGCLSLVPSLLLAFIRFGRQCQKRQNARRHDRVYYNNALSLSASQQQASWRSQPHHHQQHHNYNHYYHHQQQQGPNYHFLPQHQRDESDMTAVFETTVTTNDISGNIHPERSHHERSKSSSSAAEEVAASGQDQTPNNEHDNGGEETPMVAAENVILLQSSSNPE